MSRTRCNYLKLLIKNGGIEMMKNVVKKVKEKMVKTGVVARSVMTSNSGEGFVDSAVFSVLHCYDRIATIVKHSNTMIKIRHIVNEFVKRSKVILLDQRGEGTISQAISILSAVVLGSLLLMGIYKLIESTILPELQQRIIDMFNYSS